MAYTPPDGDDVAIDFAETEGYQPPVGDRVGLTLSAALAEIYESVDGATSFAGSGIVSLLSESAAASAGYITPFNIALTYSDSANGTTSISSVIDNIIIETAHVVATMAASSAVTETISESAVAMNDLIAQIGQTFSESASGTTTMTAGQVMAVLEAAAAVDALAGTSAMSAIITELAAAVDSFTVGSAEDITETADGSVSMSAGMLLTVLVAEAAAGAVTTASVSRQSASVTETASGSVAMTSGMTISVSVTETGQIRVSVSHGGAEVAAWVLNTEGLAVSRYENFDFNSMAWDGRQYLGLKDGGLYVMGGDDDDGNYIASFVETGAMDFGTPHFKRYDEIVLGYKADGPMRVTLRSALNGEESLDVYDVDPDYVDANEMADGGRAEFGKGIRSRFIRVGLVNVAGSSFTLKDWRLLPIVLRRRI